MARLDRLAVRARRFLDTYRYPITVWAGSRALTFLAIAMLGWVGRPPGSTSLSAVLVRPLALWDGFWYTLIADHGYDSTVAHGNSSAFFPLYPMLIRGLTAVVPLSAAGAGVILSNLLFCPALIVLYRLTADRFGDVMARRTVLYLAISPLSFVFSAVYTESLALLLIASAFLLLERGTVRAACIVASLAVLARPVGIALLPAFAWRLVREERRLSRRLVIRLVPLVLLPIALGAFEFFLWWRTGEVFATNAAEGRGWGRVAEPFFVLLLPFAVLHGIWIAVSGTHDLGLALSAFAAWAYTMLLGLGTLVRKVVPVEYAIFTACCLVLPAYTGTWLGFPRYGLVLFPLVWVVAHLAESRPRLDSMLRMVMPALLVGFAFVAYGRGTFTP